ADHTEVKKIYNEVQSAQAIGIVPGLILTEYYYKTWQFFGKQAAELRTNSFMNSKINVCDMTDDDIFNAGAYKVRNSLLSIADCVALSYAIREGAIIITTEDEMKSIKKAKVRKINY
ncbi:MAG: PIN domain-containing protein, partial [Candidatus Heimdallarchaeota archaeon]